MSTGWGQRHSTANHVREGVGGEALRPQKGLGGFPQEFFFDIGAQVYALSPSHC